MSTKLLSANSPMAQSQAGRTNISGPEESKYRDNELQRSFIMATENAWRRQSHPKHQFHETFGENNNQLAAVTE